MNCSVCHRKLTDPVSVKRRIGPICFRRYMTEIEEKEMQKKEEQESFIPFTGDIICDWLKERGVI